MPNGLVSLGYLRMQAQQRSDMENNPSISNPEWNQYISSSYKELYDLLVAAYGNEYYLAQPFQFAITGAQFYPLPDGSANFLINGSPAPAFYKLTGVDLQYSASPTGWVSLRNFEMIDRNKYANPNTAINFLGYTNLKYRVSGSNLWMIPTPAASQTAQIWYVPEPTNLQFAPTCALTLGNPVIPVSDGLGLSVGMSAFALSGILPGTTITAIDTTVSPATVTLSVAPVLTLPIQTVVFWTDAVTIDGISGWEEFIIVDAAIKANIKTEDGVEELAGQKQAMVSRIESMANGRDIGQAQHVSDALSINGCGDSDYGDGFGGMGFGGGFGGY